MNRSSILAGAALSLALCGAACASTPTTPTADPATTTSTVSYDKFTADLSTLAADDSTVGKDAEEAATSLDFSALHTDCLVMGSDAVVVAGDPVDPAKFPPGGAAITALHTLLAAQGKAADDCAADNFEEMNADFTASSTATDAVSAALGS